MSGPPTRCRTEPSCSTSSAASSANTGASITACWARCSSACSISAADGFPIVSPKGTGTTTGPTLARLHLRVAHARTIRLRRRRQRLDVGLRHDLGPLLGVEGAWISMNSPCGRRRIWPVSRPCSNFSRSRRCSDRQIRRVITKAIGGSTINEIRSSQIWKLMDGSKPTARDVVPPPIHRMV